MNPGLRPMFSALAFCAALVCSAAVEKTAVPFRELDFPAATAAAAKEGKLVLIDFYTTWCGPCKQLDATTWTDVGVGGLVGDKTVPLRIDAEKEGKGLAERYKINAYPTILLLKADGTELDRIVGFREPAEFTAEFTAGLNGKPALKRAREEVEAAAAASAQDQVQAREKLARELMQNGKYDEALTEYLWLYDDGMKTNSSFTGVRTSFLTSEMGRLAAKYPPAAEALRTRRDDARARLLAGVVDRNAAGEFSALNEALGDMGANLALFDQLPAGDARRPGFGLRVYAQLIEARRYHDALEVQPFGTMKMLFEHNLEPPATIKGPARDSMRAFALKNAAINIEALAGGGDLDHARELRELVLAADASDTTKAAIKERLARAGVSDL